MLRINQLKLPVGHTPEQLKKKIIKSLQIRERDLKQYSVRKRSIDARKSRSCIMYIPLILLWKMRPAF